MFVNDQKWSKIVTNGQELIIIVHTIVEILFKMIETRSK
jgi:hypothetical protein